MVLRGLNKMVLRHKNVALGAVVMTCFGALGIAWAGAQDTPTTGTPSKALPESTPAATRVSPVVTRQLAAFKTAADLSTSDMAQLRGPLMSSPSRRFGLNASLARRVGTGIAGHPLYLVPGNGYVCLGGQDVGSSCVDEHQLEDSRPQLDVSQCGQIPQGMIALSGIAPDGITNLAVVRAGTKTPIGIAHNAFFTTVPIASGVPDSVQWTDATGATQSLSLQLPPDTATATCGPVTL